jgi:hypothetical protein
MLRSSPSDARCAASRSWPKVVVMIVWLPVGRVPAPGLRYPRIKNAKNHPGLQSLPKD